MTSKTPDVGNLWLSASLGKLPDLGCRIWSGRICDTLAYLPCKLKRWAILASIVPNLRGPSDDPTALRLSTSL